MCMQALDSETAGATAHKSEDTAAQVSFILAGKNEEIRSSKLTGILLPAQASQSPTSL